MRKKPTISIVILTLVFIANILLWLFWPPQKVSSYSEIEPEYVPTLTEYAADVVTEHWGMGHIEAFFNIVDAESGWTHNEEHYPDQYPKMTATGLMGFLDSTWSDVGCTRTYDKREQLRCGALYIKARYGDPINAWSFHQCKHVCYNPHTNTYTDKKGKTWY